MPGDAFELTLKAVNIVLIKQSILITKQKELFTVNLAFFFKAQHFSFGSMYFALFFFFFFFFFLIRLKLYDALLFSNMQARNLKTLAL